ncbi:MAG TPA: hypothetical protein DHW71_02080 [Gammaproteobacteria bacterium]|nr:hypothetical protein [Gammaproteobacteria bacterium]MEC8009295.1 hypothetical protein [Pseudomonadota bacterium]HCK91742.1 hypothetical protein [Gammaproteobacteria bacterium]|tara:strand:+ start:107 stop:790 length:684 start_codon:yes stop_codon:yes gene_type:complete
MMKITLLFFMLVAIVGCQSQPDRWASGVLTPKWFNEDIFETYTSDLGRHFKDFDIEFTAKDGTAIHLKDCLDVALSGDDIKSYEYKRWLLLNAHCSAASVFKLAPDESISYWTSSFDFEFIQHLPAYVQPFLGGQGLDVIPPKETLAEQPGFSLIEEHENSVRVDFDEMHIDYTLVTKGDFNRDGIEDIFIQLDYRVMTAFGAGSDWVVLTKLSKNSKPMILWRDFE